MHDGEQQGSLSPVRKEQRRMLHLSVTFFLQGNEEGGATEAASSSAIFNKMHQKP